MPGMEEEAEGRLVPRTQGGNRGKLKERKGKSVEMSSWLGRSCKMQSFLSQDKKLGFYSKFHEKPLESSTQENGKICFFIF